MADYSVITDISNRAKEYLRDMQDAYFFERESSVLWNRFIKENAAAPKIAVKAYPDKYILPYRDQFPMNFLATGETNPLPPAGKENTDRMTTSLKFFKGRVQDTWEKIKLIQDETGFIAQKSAQVVDDCLMSAQFNMNLHLYGYEYGGGDPDTARYLNGCLGTVSSFASPTVTMQNHPTNPNDLGVRWAMRGMKVVFATIDEVLGGTAPAASEAMINSVPDNSNSTFVISDPDGSAWSGTNPEAGDLVMLGYVDDTVAADTVYLSYDNAPVPLIEHVGRSTAANYQGKSRSGNVILQGIVEHNSGVNETLTEGIIRDCLSANWIRTKKPSNPGRIFVCNKAFENTYRGLFDSVFIYSTDGKVNRGQTWQNLPLIDGMLPCVDEFMWPGGFLLLDPTSFLVIAPMGGQMVEFNDLNGPNIYQMIGTNGERDILECRYRGMYQLACVNPSMNLRRKDIT